MRVSIKNLSFAYTQKIILNKISFTIESGEYLTLVGKNGTGKSTFIKCLLKILKVSNNTIFLNDSDINTTKKLVNVGYVPQKVEFNYEFPITVSEILTSAYSKRKDAYYTSVINSMDLNHIYRDNINTLSGGQIQRVFIARALLNHPKLLVLDEPTVGVDIDNIKSLYQTLERLKKQGVTVILSTHDLDFAKQLTDYYLEFNEMGDYKFYRNGE